MSIPDAELVEGQLRAWREDPMVMVRSEFGVEPDAWQVDALRAFPSVDRLAMKACKGPGKTAVLAWLILNFLATRFEAKVAATSITEDNLSDNLWPEIAKWMARSKFFSSLFAWSKTRVVCRARPEIWFATARTWPKHAAAQRQADTLAGLHADHILFVLDESGGIPQAVMTTAEAVLGSGIEAKVALALTFALPNQPTALLERLQRRHTALHDGDPFAPGQALHDFDPFV